MWRSSHFQQPRGKMLTWRFASTVSFLDWASSMDELLFSGSHETRLLYADSLVTCDEQYMLGLAGDIGRMALHPTRPLLAIACNKAGLIVLNASTWRNCLSRKGVSFSVAWSGSGQVLAAGVGADVVVLDSEYDFREVTMLQGQEPEAHSTSTTLAFSPNDKLLVSANKSSSVRVWDWAAGTILADLTAAAGSIFFSAVFLDDARIAAGDHAGRIILFNEIKPKGRDVCLGAAHSKPVWALAQQGNVLVSGSDDGTIAIWDTSTLTLTKTIKSDGPVGAVLLRSETEIFAGIAGHHVVEYNTLKQGVQSTYSEHRGEVYGLALRQRRGLSSNIGTDKCKLT